jgi:MSHA pilin protein MshC
MCWEQQMSSKCGRAREAAFTLVELITTLALISIVALVALPRMTDRGVFESRGFHDEGQAVVRFAQKTAIAWRRSITVCISASEISAISNSNCAAPVAVIHPSTGAALKSTAPAGVTLSPVGSFAFDGMGRPSAAATITLTSTLAGDPARQIVVAAETGYVSH